MDSLVIIKPVLEDSILVVSKSGCKFIGDKLFHSDNCSCDDEYDQEAQNV